MDELHIVFDAFIFGHQRETVEKLIPYIFLIRGVVKDEAVVEAKVRFGVDHGLRRQGVFGDAVSLHVQVEFEEKFVFVVSDVGGEEFGETGGLGADFAEGRFLGAEFEQRVVNSSITCDRVVAQSFGKAHFKLRGAGLLLPW